MVPVLTTRSRSNEMLMRHVSRFGGIVLCAAALLLCRQAAAWDDPPATSKNKPRFIDRGEYVEDTETGLLWQKDGSASGRKNYYEAAEYAKNLKLGGLTGWRVPTAKELGSV